MVFVTYGGDKIVDIWHEIVDTDDRGVDTNSVYFFIAHTQEL